MNIHYTNRYKKFITYCQTRILSPTEPTCSHHILPKSLGGSNDATNLIKLSLREHYLAHLLLAKATDRIEMIFAWHMMRGHARSSRTFSSLTSKHIQFLSDKMKGKKSIQSLSSSETKWVGVEEARALVAEGSYRYCGSGFVVCVVDGENVAVPQHLYDNAEHHHINKGTFCVFDLRDRTHKKVSRVEYENNQEFYSTNLTDVVCAKDMAGNMVRVTRAEYATGAYTHPSTGMVVVHDEDGLAVKISKDEQRARGLVGIKTGRVNVYFQDGSSGEVSREEFKQNRHMYTTANEGMVTAIEIATGLTIRISREEFRVGNGSVYRHPTAGLVLTCPHCNKTGGNSMKRWHFDHCKQKKGKIV